MAISVNVGFFEDASRITLVLLALLAISGCSYRDGVSSAVEPPVLDGRIVLVKQGQAFGAFILSDQRVDPEGSRFDWYCRTDGKGTFRARESEGFRHGRGIAMQMEQMPFLAIRFGPFTVGWSGAEEGKGYVYYGHLSARSVRSDSLRICVTAERDISKVSARDSRWVYRAYPGDKGTKVDGSLVR